MKWFIIHLPEPKPIPLTFWFEVWKCLEFTYKLILQNKELLSREDYERFLRIRSFVCGRLKGRKTLVSIPDIQEAFCLAISFVKDQKTSREFYHYESKLRMQATICKSLQRV